LIIAFIAFCFGHFNKYRVDIINNKDIIFQERSELFKDVKLENAR
jgi:hypothetical protein